MQSKARFLQQKSENELVRDELGLDEGANVFKVVGPVLFKQDYDDVKENVQKRLERGDRAGTSVAAAGRPRPIPRRGVAATLRLRRG